MPDPYKKEPDNLKTTQGVAATCANMCRWSWILNNSTLEGGPQFATTQLQTHTYMYDCICVDAWTCANSIFEWDMTWSFTWMIKKIFLTLLWSNRVMLCLYVHMCSHVRRCWRSFRDLLYTFVGHAFSISMENHCVYFWTVAGLPQIYIHAYLVGNAGSPSMIMSDVL